MDLPLKTIHCARRLGRLLLLSFLLLAGAGISRVWAQAGGVDSTFTGNVNGGQGIVNGAAIEADGKIVIGGSFGIVGTSGRNDIAILNSDGSVYTPFNPGSGANRAVNCVAIQTDGKLVVGGNFTLMNGQAQPYLCRLNLDGSLDATFAPALVGTGVFSVAIQPDGKIVAGGLFSIVNGSGQSNLVRLNADGSLDGTFWHEAGTNGQINSVVVQGCN